MTAPSPQVTPPVKASDHLLDVRHLTQTFKVTVGRTEATLSAVSDISFTIDEGQTLGLVGETGCGKSTTARAILQSPRPTKGQVLFDGEDLTGLRGGPLRRSRRKVQMVFQDPYSSLDPRWRVSDLVAEPLRINRIGGAEDRGRRSAELLDLVGLDPSRFGERKPHQLSGGQAQRVGIARALALSPKLVICDEAVSSLDVSIQAQVLNLLEQLRRELRLTYLFIAHDLAVVKHVSDRVGVMYLGTICEIGDSEEIYRRPAHPYTAALLAAIPTAEATSGDDAASIAGREVAVAQEMPSPLNPPTGCRYRTLCPKAADRCRKEAPTLRSVGPGHDVACHFPLLLAEPDLPGRS